MNNPSPYVTLTPSTMQSIFTRLTRVEERTEFIFSQYAYIIKHIIQADADSPLVLKLQHDLEVVRQERDVLSQALNDMQATAAKKPAHEPTAKPRTGNLKAKGEA